MNRGSPLTVTVFSGLAAPTEMKPMPKALPVPLSLFVGLGEDCRLPSPRLLYTVTFFADIGTESESGGGPSSIHGCDDLRRLELGACDRAAVSANPVGFNRGEPWLTLRFRSHVL